MDLSLKFTYITIPMLNIEVDIIYKTIRIMSTLNKCVIKDYCIYLFLQK